MVSERIKIIGGKNNFWLYSKSRGFDLTHPETPTSPFVHPRIHLNTTKEPIEIDPKKTALVVVDLQNYFLSPSLGRPSDAVGIQVVDKLLEHAIPACRKASIKVVWLGFGLTEDDIERMPPMMLATTDKDTNFDGGKRGEDFGAELGMVNLNGNDIDAGRKLFAGAWNAQLYEPLDRARRPEDLVLNKNRLSGFWKGLINDNALRSQDIRTLIFAGDNLDQCVASSLLDAFHEGFDIILLSDGTGTTSPDFARKSVLWNCELGWGFMVSCEELSRGVEKMESLV